MINLKPLIAETWNSLKRSGSFTQNYAFVLSGTGLNILIQIAIAPLLTRIYGPEAYGIFSLFNALCTNFALVATLRFPQALLLPEKDNDFYVLMRLSLLSALLVSGILFIVLFFASVPFLSLLNAEKLSTLYFVIPVMVFFISMNQIFGQWQYRLNKFKLSVAIDTGVLISVRIFNLAYGLITLGGVFGLVIGDIAGKAAGLLISGRFIIREKISFLFAHISWKSLKKTFTEYKRYPVINLPGVWISMLGDQLPVFFFSSSFGLTTVGMLSLAVSILDLPKRFFVYTVTSVFYQKAVELKKTSFTSLQSLVEKMMYGFLAISVVPYAIITAFGPELFSFAFGSPWVNSGVIARYLSIYCVFELLYISLDSLYYVFREEKRLFVFQVSNFIIRFLALFAGIQIYDSFESAVLFLAVANVAIYSIQLSYLLRIVKLNWKKHLLTVYTVVGFFTLMSFLIRELL